MFQKLTRALRNIFLFSAAVFAVAILLTLIAGKPILKTLPENIYAIAVSVLLIIFMIGVITFALWLILVVFSRLLGLTYRGNKYSFYLLILWPVSTVAAIYMLNSPVSDSSPDYFVFLITVSVVGASAVISFLAWLYSLQSKLAKRLSVILFALALFAVFLYAFVMRIYKVVGASMSPVLNNGEYILTNIASYKMSAPQRDDIVVFTSPKTGDKNIGRIIGLPGETISIIGGRVYINGQILEEPYVTAPTNVFAEDFLTDKDVLIPKNEYAIFGDNREHSNDSRQYGFVKRNAIGDKAFFYFENIFNLGLIKY